MCHRMESQEYCIESNGEAVSVQEKIHAKGEDHGGTNITSRTKLNSTKETENSDFDLEEKIDDNDESARTEALRNPLILHQIFSKLTTKFLLSSVSLVNKSWNTQARKFIRNCRICQVLNGGWKSSDEFLLEYGMMPPGNLSLSKGCQFIHQVDNLCCEITRSERIIPYNRLELFVEPVDWNCRLYSEDCGPVELKSQLKLKYLKIVWDHRSRDADCDEHRTLKALLRQTCTELQKLELQYLSTTFEQCFDDWFPTFPKLEELVLVNVPAITGCKEHDKQKNILTRLLDGAPKLRKIKANGFWTIESVPEDKYALLEVMEFDYSMQMHQDCIPKVLAAKPKLCELNILDFAQSVNRSMSMLDQYLQQLLQDSAQSLESINLHGLCPLGKISLPSLGNLTKLILRSTFGVWKGYWTVLSSIDFERVMPLLKDLQVFIRISNGQDVYEDVPLWPDPMENWNRNEISPTCRSLKKLRLQVEAGNLNFGLLKSVFPNIVSLTLKMDNNRALDRDVMQLPDICEMWPDLEELEITGDHNFLERCYDADFCGIHEQEAEMLKEMGDEHLQHVKIVPIKPSIPTMRKLQSLRIDLRFDDLGSDTDSDEPNAFVEHYEGNFISNVTRLVALRGIPVSQLQQF